VHAAVASDALDIAHFVGELRQIEHPGLLGWCFGGTGQNETAFARLRELRPQAWAACVQAFV